MGIPICVCGHSINSHGGRDLDCIWCPSCAHFVDRNYVRGDPCDHHHLTVEIGLLPIRHLQARCIRCRQLVKRSPDWWAGYFRASFRGEFFGSHRDSAGISGASS